MTPSGKEGGKKKEREGRVRRKRGVRFIFHRREWGEKKGGES